MRSYIRAGKHYRPLGLMDSLQIVVLAIVALGRRVYDRSSTRFGMLHGATLLIVLTR